MNTTASFKFIVISLAAVIFFFAANRETPQYLNSCRINIYSTTGNILKVNAEIADSDKERETGLMFRKSMPFDHGMLFVFENDRILSFWMKNTYLPLDIAYIDSNGIIKDIYTMRPLDTSIIYTSTKAVRYALEVNSGWFSQNGIFPGARIGFNGCVGK